MSTFNQSLSGFTQSDKPLWMRSGTGVGQLKGEQLKNGIQETFEQYGIIKDPYTLHVPTEVHSLNNRLQYNDATGALYWLDSNVPLLQSLQSPTLVAQRYDGQYNNPFQTTLGSEGKALLRKASSNYKDGISTLAERGVSNPAPRVISNALCKTNAVEPNSLKLTNMVWVWGQFIDHAITLTDTQVAGETANMVTSGGDVNEDFPGRTIGFARSLAVDGTSPREQPNNISAFLDGTHVYGTTTARVYALRLKDGSGKLKTLTSNNETLLPLNIESFPNANPTGLPTADLFLAGDVRANENIFLTALHTLFVREHNRLCSQIVVEHPTWTGNDELIFQNARHRVNAIIQHITYDEFLPALLGETLPLYKGYKPYIDPTIATEFSTAGYRLGHAMIPSSLQTTGNVNSTILLRNAFFTPSYIQNNGIDDLLLGCTLQRMKEINTHVVDDLRNHLFGPPTAGALLDLASLNIQRGRDHGLPGYNAMRQAYGLTTVNTYAGMTSDTALQTSMASLYDSINDVDPWIACLAEDHVSGAAVGPLVKAILVDQFIRLRDGDRFWYENNPCLNEKLLEEIKQTTLKNVIVRNTTLTTSQVADDVFHTL